MMRERDPRARRTAPCFSRVSTTCYTHGAMLFTREHHVLHTCRHARTGMTSFWFSKIETLHLPFKSRAPSTNSLTIHFHVRVPVVKQTDNNIFAKGPKTSAKFGEVIM